MLNNIFGPPEPSQKIFFSDHREVNLSQFLFFAKNHGKNNAFVFFGIHKKQKILPRAKTNHSGLSSTLVYNGRYHLQTEEIDIHTTSKIDTIEEC